MYGQGYPKMTPFWQEATSSLSNKTCMPTRQSPWLYCGFSGLLRHVTAFISRNDGVGAKSTYDRVSPVIVSRTRCNNPV